MTIQQIPTFTTRSGIETHIYEEDVPYSQGIQHLVQQLNHRQGMSMSSGVEYPGRYSRWELAFVDPPLEFIARGSSVYIKALSDRGKQLLKLFKPIWLNHANLTVVEEDSELLVLEVTKSDQIFSEEHRSLQPTVVTPLRLVIEEFKGFTNSHIGFYGAFGYELIYQFDPIELAFDRDSNEKIYHLFWVDCVTLVDRKTERASRHSAEFYHNHIKTQGVSNKPYTAYPASEGWQAGEDVASSHTDAEFADLVTQAREHMKVGDVFETVLSRKFCVDFEGSISELYQRMQQLNPSPYEFCCQLGDEQLIGTSPEMFVRVSGSRIESCPISGTIRRGNNAMEDEANIRALLNSYKDEVELTMCTDVDRNDKSRICEPGSVKLISRRSIERYVGLFHTVDHVEGKMRPEFTGLDGFLSHMWAVTLTGAPKKQAVQIIENLEASPRRWYGGAVGRLSFNGNVNTCITIRTIHLKDKKAHYQSGATLVWDSEPFAEAEETKIKATPFYRALGLPSSAVLSQAKPFTCTVGKGLKAVMIDCEDSFVHTLGDYFRQCGMDIVTYRAGVSVETILQNDPHLVIHSPGPGRPEQFGVSGLVRELASRGVPQFGVCLGLQGMVEAFGGQLEYLEDPRHGKVWRLMHEQKGVMKGLPLNCQVAAYHSIVANKESLPTVFEVTAENEFGQVMAIKHKVLPIQAVQFHPESILSMQHDVGLRLVCNAIVQLTQQVEREGCPV